MAKLIDFIEQPKEIQAIRDVVRGRITFTEFEKIYRVKGNIEGVPEYLDDAPNYEQSHRDADKAIAQLNKWRAKEWVA